MVRPNSTLAVASFLVFVGVEPCGRLTAELAALDLKHWCQIPALHRALRVPWRMSSGRTLIRPSPVRMACGRERRSWACSNQYQTD